MEESNREWFFRDAYYKACASSKCDVPSLNEVWKWLPTFSIEEIRDTLKDMKLIFK